MPVGPFRVLNDFNLDVTAGNVPGYMQETIVGLLQSTPATPLDVWNGGGIYTGQPTSNASEIIRLTSSSMADNLAGTGAHLYRVTGLLTPDSDDFTDEFVLAHPTNGQLPVTTVNAYYRIRRILVITAGSANAAVGDITVQHNVTTANIFAVVPTDWNVSQLGAITVPARQEMTLGKTTYSLSRAGGNLSGNAIVSLNFRAPGSIYQSFSTVNVTNNSPVNIDTDNIGPIPEGSDIKFTVREASNTDIVLSIIVNLTFRSTA